MKDPFGGDEAVGIRVKLGGDAGVRVEAVGCA